MKWVVPSVLGKPPEPRYQHSLDFYRRGNCLIVHGGRCDSFGGRVYNDMFILRLGGQCLKLRFIGVGQSDIRTRGACVAIQS